MKTLFHFLILAALVVIAVVIGVVLGAYGAWYFSWLVGTIMIVLFAAAGGVLYDTQQKERKANGS
ncbi:hypothetical protein LIG30_2269 [Burkholderia sp. lig30]|jgi:hypothetical protein|uniref:hypothetical protein n=1 Tax=Burkholderia sp. lig30 TaxID=1192124 RepID=UPI000460BD89|nr:hypothetical protein [Burkholderia sp. lig30]KDB08649.1 hypothetical protein LIG30_2269 [Burkholderia sp. lig30]